MAMFKLAIVRPELGAGLQSIYPASQLHWLSLATDDSLLLVIVRACVCFSMIVLCSMSYFRPDINPSGRISAQFCRMVQIVVPS